MIPDEAVEAAARAIAPHAFDAQSLARAALEAAAPHMLGGLRDDLVKLAKEFDTTTEGTLAYTATDGRFQMRKNAHDQLMYIVDNYFPA